MPQNLRSHLQLVAPAAAMAAMLVSVAACNIDAPTSSPSSSLRTVPTVSANKVEDRMLYDLDGDGHLSKAEKLAKKLAKEQEKRAFDALMKDWKAYKDAIKKGNIHAELLRCEPEKREFASKLIGPKGGKIDIGRHSLIIPAGALTEDVQISGTVISGPIAEVDFEPHGLQFARPVELEMDYGHCIVPEGMQQTVVYIDNGFKLLEDRPSFDDDDLKNVRAWLDHFSGYAIATRKPQ
jgi:hypothetical protein